MAEIVCCLSQSNHGNLNTLGVALYRVGDYGAALEVLTAADEYDARFYRSSIPADLAFLALTCHRLGQEEKARTHLLRLREALEETRWSRSEEARSFLKEVETVLGTGSSALDDGAGRP